MKIAVLAYIYPSIKRIYITSLCEMLENLGHEIKGFSFFNRDYDTHDPSQKDEDQKKQKFENKYFIIEEKILNFSPIFLKDALNYFLNLLKEQKNKYSLSRNLRQIRHTLKNEKFDFSIGIEKGGIICAYELYKISKVPFFYFSLELYDENHNILNRPTMQKTMRKMEIIALKKAAGTIIADEDRKNSLYKTGNIDTSKPAFYLPVSFNENSIEYVFSHRKPTVSNKKIILNFGNNRIPDDFFIALLKELPDSFVFLMHNLDTKYHEEISQNFSVDKMQFSNKPMNEKEIMNLINDSFIGLSWYEDDHINAILVAFSSEKTARYLAAGKPIIANAKTNFPQLFSSIKCGIAVNTPDEFIDALQTISQNYQEYCTNARKAFDQIYKLSNYEQSLNAFLIKNL